MSKPHIYTKEMKKKAVNYSFLKNRLDLNKKLQNKNFDKWLFSKIKIKKDDKILDVGCGEGAQSIKFLKVLGKNGSVSSIDINKGSVKKLIQKTNKDKRIEVQTGDMAKLDYYIEKKFKQKEFTLAHSSYALYYSPQRLEVLKIMAERLKKNGRLYVFTPCSPHGMVDLAAKFHKIPNLVKQSLNFGRNILEKEFRKLFWEVQINYFQSVLKFKNLEDFKTFYKSTTYFNSKKKNNIYDYINKVINSKGNITFEKNGYLITGYDKKN